MAGIETNKSCGAGGLARCVTVERKKRFASRRAFCGVGAAIEIVE